MGKILLKVFHAHIRAPFEVVYCIDLVRHRTKSGFDLPDLLIGVAVLELQQHDVTQYPGGFLDVFAFGDMLGLVNMDNPGLYRGITGLV